MSNSFSCIGRCVQDAEVRASKSGLGILTVTIANDVGFGDNKKTNFIRCTWFGKKAEGRLVEHLVKGRQVFVSGVILLNSYTGQDGVARQSLELRVNDEVLIGKLEAKQESKPVNNFDDYDNLDAPF
jgi:single-strand DNA-binding protein